MIDGKRYKKEGLIKGQKKKIIHDNYIHQISLVYSQVLFGAFGGLTALTSDSRLPTAVNVRPSLLSTVFSSTLWSVTQRSICRHLIALLVLFCFFMIRLGLSELQVPAVQLSLDVGSALYVVQALVALLSMGQSNVDAYYLY